MGWNRPWTWMPIVAMIVTAAIETKAARTAYSIAACPSCCQRRLIEGCLPYRAPETVVNAVLT